MCTGVVNVPTTQPVPDLVGIVAVASFAPLPDHRFTVRSVLPAGRYTSIAVTLPDTAAVNRTPLVTCVDSGSSDPAGLDVVYSDS